MRATIAAALALVALLTACGGGEREIEIAYGTDVCEYCRMTIDDPALAAAFEGTERDVHLFDEPGCMASWLRDRRDNTGKAMVRDAGGRGWLEAQQAYFARGQRTPMAFGFVAYADRDAALAASRPAGAPLASWTSILTEELKANAPTR
ncbi:MAG TPA: hypothetical protein VFU01_04910 [Gemmatimonadaceae bacterium]|nr:hypothetical protein [Gemmatimonadaceae bacterium]